MPTFQRIVLASRASGEPVAANFRLERVETPALADGQLLIRSHYLSLDPYMRGRMSEAKSYAASQALNETMIGGAVGEVIESRNPQFAVGDMVVGYLGWTEIAVSDGAQLRKIDTSRNIPLSAYLGAVGMPGMTAWYGLNQLIKPKAGETVVVSAASGAVGSAVGQLAKAHGCRVVGIAGGLEKCAYVVREYGFDACVDYKAGNLMGDLEAATPNGIDGIFENVGGVVFDAALARTNAFGRIAICGLVAGYNGEAAPVNNFKAVLTNRLQITGFIVGEHLEFWPHGLAELGQLVESGKLKYRETVAQGLETAPQAFIGLLKGKNFGKQLVKLI